MAILAIGENSMSSEELFFYRKLYDLYVMPLYTKEPLPIDLRNIQQLYGKINYNRDWVYLAPREENFKTINNGKREIKMLNFVADAFVELRTNIRSRKVNSYKSNFGLKPGGFLADFNAKQGYTDPLAGYTSYLDLAYMNFVNRYLESGYLLGKIVQDFETFMLAFMKYFEEVATTMPITRTAFLSSSLVKHNMSGLCVEISDRGYSKDMIKHRKYVKDDNFKTYVKIARKYGFMVDRHAPWRLVADITSPYMAKKMLVYGLNKDNLFEKYYVPSYLYDVANLRMMMFNWYNFYTTQFPSVKVTKMHQCQRYVIPKVTTASPPKQFIMAKNLDRKKFNSIEEYDAAFGGYYWLRMYLFIRLKEVAAKYTDNDFKLMLRKVFTLFKHKGLTNAINHVNFEVKKHETNVINKETLGIMKGVTNVSIDVRDAAALGEMSLKGASNTGYGY